MRCFRLIGFGLWMAAATTATASELTAVESTPSGWQFLHESDGVVTQVRPFPGSDYDEVRAVASVCAPLSNLLAFIGDARHFSEWIPDTRVARAVDADAFYLRTSSPWPVRDRDMVYRLREQQTTPVDELLMVMEGAPDLLPPDSGAVRMRAVSGSWRFRARGLSTDIVLVTHIDPGGNVPVMLARRRVLAMPGRMLGNLKSRYATGCPG